MIRLVKFKADIEKGGRINRWVFYGWGSRDGTNSSNFYLSNKINTSIVYKMNIIK